MNNNNATPIPSPAPDLARAAHPAAQGEDIEFMRMRAASRRFGMSERILHTWIKSGAVQSSTVLTPGKKRSKMRLVNVASLRRFITGGSTTEGAA